MSSTEQMSTQEPVRFHKPWRGALALVAATVLSAPPPVHAQSATPTQDTVTLHSLYVAAERNDSRAVQGSLLRQQDDLRQRSIQGERLPTIAFNGQAQYLSAVTSLAAPSIPGLTIPQPFNDQYDTYVLARQSLFDPSRKGRAAVEAAQSAQSEATVTAALYRTRLQVNDLFFSILQANAQLETLAAALAALEAHRTIAAARVRDGVALPSEELAISAEITRRRQARETLRADRLAAMHTLASLTGLQMTENSVLSTVGVSQAAARATDTLLAERARPEYGQFNATRQTIASRIDALAAVTKPRVSAFGRAGYGRPGLNQLSRDFDAYWIAGVQVEWSPLRWGGIGTSPDRDRQILKLQEDIVASEEAAFTDGLRRSLARDIEVLNQLNKSLLADDEIIALRQQILSESRLRFEEGVITSAQLVDHETDLLNARLERDARHVSIMRLEAQILTTAGIPIQ